MFLQLLLIFIQLQKGCTQKINCVERDRPISANLFDLVDVHFNENVTLQCHFCDETDDGQPKNWFRADTLQKEPNEITPSMENDLDLNRIVVSSDHSLNIYNVSVKDSGLYYCRIFGENNTRNTEFNYFVDIVDGISADVESGNLSDWKQYYEELFAPINKLFAESEGPEFVRARNELKVSMEVISHWERWGKCLCDKPGGKRVKIKRGVCRIKLRTKLQENIKYDEDMFFLKIGDISCRSIRLRKFFPDISNRTKVIPDFIHLENCEETCNPDKDGTNVGWKVGKTKAFKYRKTFVLLEKSHLTLVCPESTLENKVVWTKRGKTIQVGDTSYPHMYVDSFNTLYLVNVTSFEEGNYSCQVDDIQMQRIIIHIVSKSKFLSGELTRHLGYLGFVLALTVPCYCAGLVVTWWRRSTFESYEDYIKEKRKIPYEDDESESLL